MLSEFDAKVYAVVRRIPKGRVSTYAHVAAAAGCRAPRAVGQSLKRNPFAPEVPCHRVIRSDLKPGGFRGKVAGPEIERKISMLKREGVCFRKGVLADKRALFTGF